MLERKGFQITILISSQLLLGRDLLWIVESMLVTEHRTQCWATAGCINGPIPHQPHATKAALIEFACWAGGSPASAHADLDPQFGHISVHLTHAKSTFVS